MKFLSLVFILLGLASAAPANELAVLIGIRSTSGDTDINAASVSSNPDYQFGLLTNLEFTKSFFGRTGFLITQRQVTLKPTAAGTVDLNFVYVDVPLTAMYRFSYAGSVFAGPVLSFNQSKDTSCSSRPGCTPNDVEAVIVPWQLGASFRMAYGFGAELYYEYLPGNIERNVSGLKTVGANFLYYFE